MHDRNAHLRMLEEGVRNVAGADIWEQCIIRESMMWCAALFFSPIEAERRCKPLLFTEACRNGPSNGTFSTTSSPSDKKATGRGVLAQNP